MGRNADTTPLLRHLCSQSHLVCSGSCEGNNFLTGVVQNEDACVSFLGDLSLVGKDSAGVSSVAALRRFHLSPI